MDLIGKRKDVSDLCGISERRVSDLVTQGVLRRPGRTGYDLCACTRAYIAFVQKHRGTMSEEQRLLITAKRRREELRLRREQGALIELDAAKQEAFSVGRRVKDVLMNEPDRLAGVVTAEQNQSTNYSAILGEMQAACEELSAWCAKTTRTVTPPMRPTRTRANGKSAHPKP